MLKVRKNTFVVFFLTFYVIWEKVFFLETELYISYFCMETKIKGSIKAKD